MRQTNSIPVFYIVRFVEPLANIALKTAIFFSDMFKFPRTPTASSVIQSGIMKRSVIAMTSCESASLTPTECKMKPRIMMAMVTAAVPLEEVPLEVAAVVVRPKEVEARLCVTIVTKLVTWLMTVETPL